MTPVWFLAALLVLDAAAVAGFLAFGNRPWALIYLGATLIQAGSIWAQR